MIAKLRNTVVLDESVYPDDFARRGLPPAELWPVIDHDALARLNYPKRVNAAVDLLDRAVAEGTRTAALRALTAGDMDLR